jgi:hypothetical protein
MNGYGTAVNGVAFSETTNDNFIGMLSIVTKSHSIDRYLNPDIRPESLYTEYHTQNSIKS